MTVTALPTATPRAATTRRITNTIRLVGELAGIWVELWPLALPVINKWFSLLTVVLVVRYWRRGDYRKNTADTVQAWTAHVWRRARLVNPQTPKLLAVSVDGLYGPLTTIRRRFANGRLGIPARSLTLTVWADAGVDVPKLAEHAASLYVFTGHEPVMSDRGPNVWDLCLHQTVTPRMVDAA